MQKDCAICYQPKSRLYNFRCPSCMEAGFAHKLTCKPCQNRCDICPFCRTEFQPDIVQTTAWQRHPSRLSCCRKTRATVVPADFNNYPEVSCGRLKRCLSNTMIMYGVACTGFFIGKGVCGRSCTICFVSGFAGSVFTTIFFLTMVYTWTVAQPRETIMCMGNSLCIMWFSTMLSLTLVLQYGTCTPNQWVNLLWLLLIVPVATVVGINVLTNLKESST